MYFLALAADYDGTIAHDGLVNEPTVAALLSLKHTGRKLILVTGRELRDLKRVFPRIDIFDRVVAENGALIFNPTTEEERSLAAPPPAFFVEMLRERQVEPLSVGRVIVATWEPNERVVLDVIRDLGLELQIIFNKGAVMVLPSGVNKAAGLSAALNELHVSAHNVVAVGDAENDHAFLRACGCAAAVANALPTVKDTADIRLAGERGDGVVELAQMVCRDDARIIPPERHGLLLGTFVDGSEAFLEPHRGSVLIAGSSGIGKSTLATALTERMVDGKYEFCIFDPEGDYDELENVVSIGDAKASPQRDEVLQLLRKVGVNLAINTQSLEVAERPRLFADLLPDISALRARTGRPHWLIIDEAHHLLPSSQSNLSDALPDQLPAAILVTVHPEAVAPDVLKMVEVVIGLGPEAASVVATFATAIGVEIPNNVPRPGDDQAIVWYRYSDNEPQLVKPRPPKQAHKRHTQKYAEGDLGRDLSFYFRGPQNALNLRAQNLILFQQIADGLDDRTWEHHLRSGDYSRWFKNVIKNDELAGEARTVEANNELDPKESRKRIGEAIRRLYTGPARSVERS